jgi:methyltransferase (TIGR00027 family)
MTAYNRGYHSLNDSPLIFNDFLAFDLLGQDVRISIEEQLLATLRTLNPVAAAAFASDESALGWMMQTNAASPIVLSRARYAEELLTQAVAAGVGQYVLLGAGLDTFAFRNSEKLGDLQVFELDHPATQSFKRQRVHELGWRLPDSVHFVPIDFTCHRVGDVLRQSGFNADVPAFFSWLGVTYYLTREEVLDTLREVALTCAPGSLIVFDYLDEAAFVERLAAPRVLRMIERVRYLGEPMLSGFDPLMLKDDLARVGLSLVEELSPADIHSRFFMGRTDHYRACEQVHFAQARLSRP